MFITFHRSITRLYVKRATHTLENYKKLKPDLFRESSVWTWAVFNIHVWCSHSHCLQRIRTLLVSAPCPQGRISVAEGRKLWETTIICQICGKVAVMCLNCNVALNSRGIIEFALIVAIATSGNPGGSG